jgi:uncharacterized protein YcfL
VKKVIITLVLLSACSSSPSTPTRTTTAPAPAVSGSQTGGADAMAAIRGFLTAAKQQDIQSLGIFWGDAQGPARDRMDRTEAEKRELIMVCYLKHDRYEIAGDAPNPGGNESRRGEPDARSVDAFDELSSRAGSRLSLVRERRRSQGASGFLRPEELG